jgi:thiamine-phosphate pyrophosphorylase
MLDRFYLIVDSAEWIARMIASGVRLFQLRIKDKPLQQVRAEVRQAKAICRDAAATLVVNDHWQLAIEEGCDFVHLGQEDLDAADIAAIRRSGLKLGISTHDRAELARALALAPDYIALGPIYPTRLKAMRFAPQGLNRIGEWKELIGNIPLVAIGGLTVERAMGVFDAGADILSVVTDVTLDEYPEDRARRWLTVTRGDAA